jgi:hypothetical protein
MKTYQPLGSSSHKWEDNIKMYLKYVGYVLHSSGSDQRPKAGPYSFLFDIVFKDPVAPIYCHVH